MLASLHTQRQHNHGELLSPPAVAKTSDRSETMDTRGFVRRERLPTETSAESRANPSVLASPRPLRSPPTQCLLLRTTGCCSSTGLQFIRGCINEFWSFNPIYACLHTYRGCAQNVLDFRAFYHSRLTPSSIHLTTPPGYRCCRRRRSFCFLPKVQARTRALQTPLLRLRNQKQKDNRH